VVKKKKSVKKKGINQNGIIVVVVLAVLFLLLMNFTGYSEEEGLGSTGIFSLMMEAIGLVDEPAKDEMPDGDDKLDLGESCISHGECKSNFCKDELCQLPIGQGSGPGTCTSDLFCSERGLGNKCENGLCKCENDEQCTLGFCDSESKRCSFKKCMGSDGDAVCEELTEEKDNGLIYECGPKVFEDGTLNVCLIVSSPPEDTESTNEGETCGVQGVSQVCTSYKPYCRDDKYNSNSKKCYQCYIENGKSVGCPNKHNDYPSLVCGDNNYCGCETSSDCLEDSYCEFKECKIFKKIGKRCFGNNEACKYGCDEENDLCKTAPPCPSGQEYVTDSIDLGAGACCQIGQKYGAEIGCYESCTPPPEIGGSEGQTCSGVDIWCCDLELNGMPIICGEASKSSDSPLEERCVKAPIV
jgi:hypothetical protein